MLKIWSHGHLYGGLTKGLAKSMALGAGNEVRFSRLAPSRFRLSRRCLFPGKPYDGLKIE